MQTAPASKFPVWSNRIPNSNGKIRKKKPVVCFGHTSFVSLKNLTKSRRLPNGVGQSHMSQNVTNDHKFGVTGTIFKISVFQTYMSYKCMYDHGLRVTNLTCIGIDPPGRTSQSKAGTLSIMSPALSFCIHVIPSLRINLVKFFGSLAWDMKFGCSVSKCDEKLNEGDSRKTLRESHG